MKKEKYARLVKILITSIIKVESEITDFIINCDKNDSLIKIVAERKEETLPLMQIINLLGLNDNEYEEFVNDVYNIVNNTINIEEKVELLLKKYEKVFVS